LFDRDVGEAWQRRIAPFKIALTSWRLSPDPRTKVRGNAPLSGEALSPILDQAPDFDLGEPGETSDSRKIRQHVVRKIERRATSKCVIDCIIPSEKMAAAVRDS
jgi:hypothetical protein